MEINYERTLGEEFELKPTEYADIAVKELNFSVLVSNCLQRDICVDNLDNIDDLIADIIDLDEEWEG